MKRALLFFAVLAAAALVATFELRRVGDAEMAPSILPGDWVLIGPGSPVVGDVVMLEDPLEPGRLVLRRVLALGPAKVRFEGGVLKVNGEGSRLREMGRADGLVVLSEANGWLIRHRDRVLRGEPAAAELGEAEAWLMADDRDSAPDSRYWGPLPAGAAGGVVWLRVGSSDAWRRALTWRGLDGPWLPPSKRGAAG